MITGHSFEEGDALAGVGQHSRESGRTPVHILVDRLEHERQNLAQQKRRLEGELSEVEASKRDALTKVYRLGMHKDLACAATNEIEAKFHRDRSKLIIEKSAIEERMNDIKNRVKNYNVQKPHENAKVVEVLLRIESLLLRMEARKEANQ